MKRLILLSFTIVVFIGLSASNGAAIMDSHASEDLKVDGSIAKTVSIENQKKIIEASRVRLEEIDFNKKQIKKMQDRLQAEIKSKKSTTIGSRKDRILRDDSKGIWINIWNYPTDVKSFISKLRKYDLDTIYLQINRSTTPVFKHQEKVDEILKEAHKRKVKVIGWSYCYLRDINTDAKKYIEPALYTSPDGERLDGMAADIEENISEWAINKYTNIIKKAIPENYTMLAIVFAPKIKPKYPWRYMGANWDVLMPMTYWHGRKHRTLTDVHDFIKHTVHELRRLTGKEDLKIHIITDGERTTPAEVETSLKAAKKFKVNSGISVYPEHLVSESILEVVKNFRL